MGYETTLHLIDIQIKPGSVEAVQKAIATKNGKGLKAIKHFLSQLYVDEGNWLYFKPTGDSYEVPYDPMDDDGTVVALDGKWSESEEIVAWLKLHAEHGGQLIQRSLEADGAAWGWEFNGRGKARDLELRPAGKWE